MDIITIEFWNNAQAIIALVLTGVVTVSAVYFGNEGRKLLKDRYARQMVATAVLYVEQVYGSEDNQLKKRMAIETAQKHLDARGIKLDVDYLSTLIESVVFSELNRWKVTSDEIDPDTVALESIG